ncbi:helix-turn-helix domain-containing protein [Kribbella sp. NPDC023855]|uniref:helix-turn-helix domain-containing protein n=1 Tax=Kribbella sp. NPDC023855 TaxID=3154698 RepID=UPI0033DC4C3C
MRVATGSQGQPAPRAFYGVGDFAQALGIGEMSVYRAIHAGRLPSLKFGGRFVIPAKVVDQLVQAAMNGGGVVDIDEWQPPADGDVAL